MKFIKNIFQVFAGLLLLFIYHIPRFIYMLLNISYAYVFNNARNLTASPGEHLKRARRFLRRGFNSELLYAALELRFALERMAHWELIMSNMASNRMLKEYDPVKKVSNLRQLNGDSAFPHEIYLVNKDTGVKIKWGMYKPLDKKTVEDIKGRLGNLLHPKDGLNLGISDDLWYKNTRKFLNTTADYLNTIQKDNQPFFAFYERDNFEMIKIRTDLLK